ncbi:MAG: NYN domain-containing protein [Prochlorotrichaceae cyanobacterium]|jgi:uncharacterized LabA/DUF88 family protein
MLRFNTAIFYDVENLTQGNNFSKDFIEMFSLKSIYKQIADLAIVDHVALQRAYANWSDPRLSVLKNEINELGIDPIQIFGFSRHQIKNAADIQLAVDAMDITLTRPHISVYVVVSGDGGFSSLAKKLHEYGRQVVGCAYGTAANEILKSVCDYFIELSLPLESPGLGKKTLLYNDKGFGVGITHPLVVRLAKTILPLEDQGSIESLDVIVQYSKKLIRWFYEDAESRIQINLNGIHLSVIREAFKHGMRSFKAERMGFSKFAEFLQFICADEPVCIGIQPPSNLLLLSRTEIPGGVEVFPDISAEDLHSVDRYQNLLATGKPRIVVNPIISDRSLFLSIIHHIGFINDRFMNDRGYTLLEWIDRLGQYFPQCNAEDLNDFCLTLVNCQLLGSKPEDKSLLEPVFQLRSHFRSADLRSPEWGNLIWQQIRDMAGSKLRSILNEDFRLEVFNQIFPKPEMPVP